MNKNVKTYSPVKERHVLPAPEEVIVKTKMAFTININAPGVFNTASLYPRYMAVFGELSKYCELDMYVEWSCKAKQHWHGTLQVMKEDDILPLYFILNDPKLSSNFTYTLKNFFGDNAQEEWTKYCTKQQHLTSPYMKKLNYIHKYRTTKQQRKESIYKYYDLHDELLANLDD